MVCQSVNEYLFFHFLLPLRSRSAAAPASQLVIHAVAAAAATTERKEYKFNLYEVRECIVAPNILESPLTQFYQEGRERGRVFFLSAVSAKSRIYIPAAHKCVPFRGSAG